VTTADRRCMVMLCQFRPKGLVRVQVYTAPEDATPSIREIPMCEPCAGAIGEAFRAKRQIHVTPGGAVYVGDMNNLLPRRRA
jgi:hypothetical protein